VNNSSLKRGSALLLAAGFSFGAGAGCASRADVIQVRNTQGQMRAALADQNQDIEELKRRYEVLRSEVADPKARPGARAPASDQVLRWLDDLSRRVAALEQAQGFPPGGQIGGPAGAVGGPPMPPPVVPGPGTGAVVMPTPVAGADPIQLALAREEASLAGTRVDPDYSAALQQIRSGDCKQAVGGLRSFVRKNAKSPLADNAQYWIGSCYYGQKDYNRAIIELNEVLLKYPKGDKVPAALLLLADAFKDSGDPIDARLILQKLISDHPSSEEAQQGKSKLQALGE
jgi:tol-pal system protein YbgF